MSLSLSSLCIFRRSHSRGEEEREPSIAKAGRKRCWWFGRSSSGFHEIEPVELGGFELTSRSLPTPSFSSPQHVLRCCPSSRDCQARSYVYSPNCFCSVYMLTRPGTSSFSEAISQARRPAPPPASSRTQYKPHPYYPPSTSTSIPAGSRNKKLIINPSSSKPSTSTAAAPGPSRTSKPLSFPVPTAPSTSATAPGSSSQWVQKTGRHMSLMNAETFEKA